MSRHGMTRGLGIALILTLACGKPSGEPPLAARGRPGRGRGGPIEFPVEVEPVAARDVEYAISAVGSVEAFEQVQITARVAGVVEQVRFLEGQSVKKGQVLAEIEPTRYGIAVRAARAALDRAEPRACRRRRRPSGARRSTR
ncbi:biotin/lipoyl-binding protein [Cystobacter fuscus]